MSVKLERVTQPNQRTQRIKVIHIYKDFDIYNGLIETFLLMAEEFDAQQIDFKVCVFNYKGSSCGERFGALGGTLDSLGASWEDNPLIVYKLYKYLKAEKPHIVQTYILKPNLYGRIAAKLARVPVIISTELTLRDQAPTMLRRVRDMFFHPVNSFLNRYTNCIICVSEDIKRQWENKYTQEKIKVVYPPFATSKLSKGNRTPLRRQFCKNGEWTIGIVGRLSEEKRHVDLLKAFVEVSRVFPNARLLIVGDGYLRASLHETVEKLGLNNTVEFVGFRENVFHFLNEMDVFVLPSRTEGSPLSIFEAMAMGLPVIATQVGGIPEVVVDKVTGLLVGPGMPSELARAIIALLSDPKTMQKMGERGRTRVFTHFNPEHFISQHVEIYQDLLASKGILCSV